MEILQNNILEKCMEELQVYFLNEMLDKLLEELHEQSQIQFIEEFMEELFTDILESFRIFEEFRQETLDKLNQYMWTWLEQELKKIGVRNLVGIPE